VNQQQVFTVSLAGDNRVIDWSGATWETMGLAEDAAKALSDLLVALRPQGVESVRVVFLDERLDVAPREEATS